MHPAFSARDRLEVEDIERVFEPVDRPGVGDPATASGLAAASCSNRRREVW